MRKQIGEKVLIKKADWAFDKKKGCWFKADCMAKVIGFDEWGRFECQTSTGVIMVKA